MDDNYTGRKANVPRAERITTPQKKTSKKKRKRKDESQLSTDDLKQQQETVSRVKQQWLETVDAFRDPVMVHDSDFRIVRVNKAYATRAGMEYRELIGRPYWEVFPLRAGPLPMCAAAVSAKFHDAEFQDEEITLESGEIFISRIFPVRDVDGHYLNSMHVFENITERKHNEVQLKLFRTLMDNAPAQLLIVDPQSLRLLDVNDTACHDLGYTREEMLELSIHDLDAVMTPAEIDRILKIMRQDGMATFESRNRRKDGSTFPVSVHAHLVHMDRPYLVAIQSDITVRKRAEEELRTSHDLLSSIVEHVPIRVFWKDAQLRYLGCNKLFARDAGMSRPQDLIGKNDSNLSWHDQAERFELEDQHIIESNKPKLGIEELQTTLDGRSVWLRTSIVPLHDGNGKVIGVLGAYEDVTDRKLVEAELKRLNWTLRALSRSNSSLIHATNEEELFSGCCQAITSDGRYPLAWIGLACQDPERTVTVKTVAGKAATALDGLEITWDDTALGQGPAGTAMRTGVTQVINDIGKRVELSPWRHIAKKYRLASSISLPIRCEGKVLGALTIYSNETNAFGKTEIQLFEEFASDVEFGIFTRRVQREFAGSVRERQLVAERLHDTLIAAIEALAATVEQRDPYTAGHQRHVADLAVAIGRELNLDEDCLEGLYVASVIHDIGKIYVPSEILSRPGKLTPAEFEIIKTHSQVGYDIVKGVDFPWPVAETILQHHERLDGSGYPRGLKGEEVILEARIMAVADIVEAMSTHRPYRAGLGLQLALEQIQKEAGTRLDPAAVKACVHLFKEKNYAFPT